jgi:hypothetical protein
MPWHIAPWADEIGGDQPLAQRICNEPIVLFREGTSRAGALADRCCHRAAPHVIPTGHPHEISKGQPHRFRGNHRSGHSVPELCLDHW